MNSNANQILALLQKENYSDAMDLCDVLLSEYQVKFMEELNVNSATDYVGVVILYSRICGLIKKPWKAFPKLESARGALCFLKDYMSDSNILAETYYSFAEAYAYGSFLPEAVSCYCDAARYFEDEEKAKDAFSSALFYQERFGKKASLDLSFAKEKFGVEVVRNMNREAKEEVKAQILTDPIESTDEYLNVRFETEEITDRLLEENAEDKPFFLSYWETKKDVLKKHFDIDWKTPAEMNPNVRFY